MLKTERKNAYKAYMDSRQWQHVRQDAFARFGDHCNACTSVFGVTVHHLFYPKDIWETSVNDVIPLCWKCHKAAHSSRHKSYAFTAMGADVLRDELIARLKRVNATGLERCSEALAWQAKQKEKLKVRLEAEAAQVAKRRAQKAHDKQVWDSLAGKRQEIKERKAKEAIEHERLRKIAHDEWMARTSQDRLKHKRLMKIKAMVYEKSAQLRARCPGMDIHQFESNYLKQLKSKYAC